MDLEIQFGEVEETKPQAQLRPDHNKHYAVAAVYAPQERDLPVFIDLDAMRDMEEHALSDTGVELGGVMLGGQFEDEHGRPFVLITDSLRAQHYEATKGSFKFTHDTWEQITRERDEFPDELQMVGWYHTHPDWGVFLSGMDMFICDHFFNKKLDVALVIDPCRQDRGFFQWTGDPQQRVRRTDGFFLTASRFRQYELEQFATYLEGRLAMSGDPRLRGGYSTPVVHVDGTQANWQTVAVLGMLAMQFCFLMLIAWRLMLAPTDAAATAQPSELAVLRESVDRLNEAQGNRADVEAKTRVLDRIVSQWEGAPQQGLINSLAEKESEVVQLQGDLLAHQALERELKSQVKSAKLESSQAESNERRLANLVDSLKDKVDQMEEQKEQTNEQVANLEQRLAAYEGDPAVGFLGNLHWTWIVLGATLGVLAVGGIVATVLKQKNDDDAFVASEEPSREANKEVAAAQNRRESQE